MYPVDPGRWCPFPSTDTNRWAFKGVSPCQPHPLTCFKFARPAYQLSNRTSSGSKSRFTYLECVHTLHSTRTVQILLYPSLTFLSKREHLRPGLFQELTQSPGNLPRTSQAIRASAAALQVRCPVGIHRKPQRRSRVMAHDLKRCNPLAIQRPHGASSRQATSST